MFRNVFSLSTILLCLFISSQQTAKGQVLDLLRLELTKIPKGRSNISYQRQRALFNLPIKIDTETYIVAGLDYSSIDLTFEDEVKEFNTDELEQFQILSVNLGYLTTLKSGWKLGISGKLGFTSNLSTSKLLDDDLAFSGLFIFINDRKEDPTLLRPYRWILGVSYSENGGISFPIPFISYYRRFHPKWSYNLGIPRTNLQYRASEKVRFKLYAELDGFNSNLQRSVLVREQTLTDRIRMVVIVGGIRAEYNINDHIEIFSMSNYILTNNVQLINGRDQIIKLNNNNEFYLRFGIRLKP